MISLPVIVKVVSGPIVWRKLVVALRLRFPTIKKDGEGMDAGEGERKERCLLTRNSFSNEVNQGSPDIDG